MTRNHCAMSESCADKPADRGMMCRECREEDAVVDSLVDTLITDECTCISCRSDCAGIVPCEREVGDG